jgi:hypothetical protein
MSEGWIPGECIELPEGYRGLPAAAFAEIRWVDPVTGKAIVAVAGADDSPTFMPVEPGAVTREGAV